LRKTSSPPPGCPRGASTRAKVEEVVHLIEEALAQTRSLTFDLSPPILYDLGLEPALRWLAEQIEKRYGLHVELQGDKEPKLDPEVSAIVFRSVRELLTNVSKHAGVHAAKVTLGLNDGRLSVAVEDAGVCFEAARSESARSGAGFGLFSIREQIERLGAR
jgi:signal transduction histidine kinase